jgi:argininosuccinate lyase
VGAQLWAKDLPLDAAIHRFTVGDDPQLDLQLLSWDCAGSAAHARMLGEIGVLKSEEVQSLLVELKRLYGAALAGELVIDPRLEDGHTLIETELTAVLGETGGRIHTGRSRNDQVTLAQNLWTRDAVLRIQQALGLFAADLLRFAQNHRHTELPGYTHLQRAMPSSFAMWAAAYAEALIEEIDAGQTVLARLDHCPLGAAAGYGVPLPLQRKRVASLLGYRRVHVSPIDAIAARIRHGLAFCEWTASIAGVLERFAWDLSLYCSTEFGFIALDSAFTTGSSIMPQKRNPDVVELLRARCRQQRSYAFELAQVGSGLPSGYHRDCQLSKAPVLRAGLSIQELLDVAQRVLGAVRINETHCSGAMSAELFATEAAYVRVLAGEPFRAAYRAVGQELASGSFQRPPSKSVQASLGAPQRPGLELLQRRLLRANKAARVAAQRIDQCMQALWL